MTKLICVLLLLQTIVTRASALEIIAPTVPASGLQIMPEKTTSFGEGLLELLQNTVIYLRPDLSEASEASVQIIAAVMLVSMLQTFSSQVKRMADLTGTAAIAGILLHCTNSMIHLATQTILELSDYGKLLYPVMTATLAAQGGAATSASLYVGTMILDTIISSLVSSLFVPVVYLFLALAVANSMVGEDLLKNMRTLIKNFIIWCLKTLLMVFTTYMSITGIVSGTTDAAALKATKITISSVVPVVGGILSDASEAILVSAELMKNAAGIYGILAILAVFLEPFLRIGLHYLLLKATGMICGLFATKNMAALIEDFTAALGLLLAMTGSVCLLLLISTVCFMKGLG